MPRKKVVLVKTTGAKYKKKAKEREEQSQVSQVLEEKLRTWLNDYGHAEARHVSLTTQQLDGRNIPLATTFELPTDLFDAAKQLVGINEQKLNHWFNNEETDRIVFWCYVPENCTVRGRRKLTRPDWHYYADPMPPHPGFEDVSPDDLQYVVGVFDRDHWTQNPLGLMTCFPSFSKP